MSTPHVQRIELAEIDDAGGPDDAKTLVERNLALIGDMPVEMSAVIGSTSVTVEKLFELKDGDVLKLDRTLEEPVTFYLEGKPVARGHLVAVDDNFAIRISEVL